MKSTNRNRGLKRTALAVFLGACLAQGAVQAQSTAGDIVGTVPAATAGTITLKSVATGLTRQYTADSSGRFRMSSLPTGAYDLTLSDGTTTRVNVVAGQTATASFGAAASGASAGSLDTIVVLGQAVNSIDLTSTETRTTFTANQLNTLPVPQNVTSVSLLTPGTASSSSYFGNASFGGASSAENSYYVNGFNVTNLYDSLSFTEVPYQAIDQLDVQTGGYGARYGFSTGGVTSVNVKRGTNEFKGGVNYTFVPGSLREQPDPVRLKDGSIWRSYDNNSSSSSDASVWFGGPIVKDKLFFFFLGEYSKSDSTSFGSRGSGYSTAPGAPYTTTLNTTASDYTSNQPYYLLKLDWFINDNNHLEYTGFDNTQKSHYDNFDAVYSSTDINADVSKADFTGSEYLKNGGHTNILKWTSYLTDNFTMALQYGEMKNVNEDYAVNPSGVVNTYNGDIDSSPSCPYVLDYRPTSDAYGTPIGCDAVGSIGIANGKNERTGGRIDFDWQLGKHDLSFGYSDEVWKSTQGSIADTYYISTADYWIDPSLPADNIYEHLKFATGGSIKIDQRSWYVEDNWNITDNFMLYLGIRNDSFTNKNSTGDTFVSQDNIWQPRLGFTWDVLGNGNSKLYATLGRYSLPIAANVALRAASRSYYTDYYYSYDGTLDPVTAVPNGGTSYAGGIYDQVYNGEDGSVPNAAAVATKNLKPYTQDELIVGYQQNIVSDNAFLNDWQLGVKATYRRVVDAIDDTCDARAVYNAAVAAGYDVSNWPDEWTVPGGIPGCFMYNPGDDLNLSTDVNVDGHVVDIHVPAAALGPKAKRDYTALTLSADKVTEKYNISASYTWSRLNGNLEGLVKSTNGQDDTGTTSDFDFKELMYGADGALFNDHTHSFKLYGSYKFTPEWEMGLNMVAQSGSPISCLGGGWGSFGTEYGYTGVFHVCDPGANNVINGPTGTNLDRSDDDVVSKVGSYGRTPWLITVSPNITYRPNWAKGLTMQMSVLNLFNRVEATQVYETNFAYRPTAGYRDYYNFGQPKFFNTPRYVRFTIQYDF